MASRTTETKESPCSKYLEWKQIQKEFMVEGETFKKIIDGSFGWYEKNGDEGQTLYVDKPFKFAILNSDYKCFKGYDEKRKRGVWSNEVAKDTQVVKLKCKEGVLLEFPYSEYRAKDQKGEDLRAKMKDFCGKYTQSVYIAVKIDGNWEIWNLQLNKSSLTGGNGNGDISPDDRNDGWFGFIKKAGQSRVMNNFVTVGSVKFKQIGDTKFCIPVYEIGEPISKEENVELTDLTKQLEEYLKWYSQNSNKPETEEVAEHVVNEDIPY